jgi:hypothetical protein
MLQNARRNIPNFLTDANYRQLGKGNSGNLAKDSRVKVEMQFVITNAS